MSNVVHLDTVGSAIHQLQSLYDDGKINGIMILFTTPEGTFDFFSENLTYIEKLGLLQASINTVNVIEELGEEE